MLTPEREQEIRHVEWCPYTCDQDIKELLFEIDRLRAELKFETEFETNLRLSFRKDIDQLRAQLKFKNVTGYCTRCEALQTELEQMESECRRWKRRYEEFIDEYDDYDSATL